MKKILIIVSACSPLLAGVASALRPRTSCAPIALRDPCEDPADSLYRVGRAGINDGDYRRAARLFKQVVDKYPKSSSAGDALYWRAWALYQLGDSDRQQEAISTKRWTALDRFNTSTRKDAATANDAHRFARADPLRAGATRRRASRGRHRDASQGRLRQARRPARGVTMRKCVWPRSKACMSMNSEDAVPILKDVLKQRDPCRDRSCGRRPCG